MEKHITPHQRELIDLLNKLSNFVSNQAYIAENYDCNVDEKIETGIWAANHFIEEIEIARARQIETIVKL